MFADLHLHTNFSDGTYSPEEMVSQAALHKLSALALTDHDTVEGCPRAALAFSAISLPSLSFSSGVVRIRVTFGLCW